MNTEAVQEVLSDTRNCVHPACIVCSPKNARGLRMKFSINGDGSVKAVLKCEKSLEGYPGMVHGGVIASILDGAMGNCMFAHGRTTVTVEMITKFRYPLATGQEVMVSAKITRDAHPLYLLKAEIIQDGKVKASAEGKYYDQPQLFGSNEVF